MKIALFTFLTCLFLFSLAVAQDAPPLSAVKLSDFADAKPSNCAYRAAALDGITQKTAAVHERTRKLLHELEEGI